VVQDKRDAIKIFESELADNEAQLVAEAIAAAQANYRMIVSHTALHSPSPSSPALPS